MLVALLLLASFILGGILLASTVFEKNTLIYGVPLGIFFGTWLVFLLNIVGGLEAALVVSPVLIVLASAFFIRHKKITVSSFCSRLWTRSSLALLILALTAFSIVNYALLFQTSKTGDFGSAVSDTEVHLAYITSLAVDSNFPPNNPFLATRPLTYYFLPDFFSASLYRAGLSLFLSTAIYLVLLQACLLVLFFLFSLKLLKNRFWAAVAVFLILFAGNALYLNGLDFFHNGQLDLSSYLKAGWDAGYQFYPNLQTIVDSRPFLMGFAISLIVLELFLDERKSWQKYLFLGVLVGLLPLFHYSFITLLIPLVVLCALDLFERKDVSKTWLLTVFAIALLALPQLVFLSQASDFSFIKFHIGWVNENENLASAIFNVIGNFGPLLLFSLPAFVYLGKREKRIFAAVSVPLLIAFFVQSSVWPFDNIKLILFWTVLAAVFSAETIRRALLAIRRLPVQVLFIMLTSFVLLFGGIVSQTHYYFFRPPFGDITSDELKVCESIAPSISSDQIILTRGQKTCLYVFYGKKVFFGEKKVLWTYGVNVAPFIEENLRMLEGDCSLIKKYRITYFYDGGQLLPPELQSIDKTFIEKNMSVIYSEAGNTLYRINCR